MKHLLIILIGIVLLCLAVGCETLGTADQQTMMHKWQSKKVTIDLLNDINLYSNYAKKGTPSMPVAYLTDDKLIRDSRTTNKISGTCGDQALFKWNILHQLNIPCRLVRCDIIRYDPYHPSGHVFVIAYLEGKSKMNDFDTWIMLDNGCVQDVPWSFGPVKKSTSGVINYKILENRPRVAIR